MKCSRYLLINTIDRHQLVNLIWIVVQLPEHHPNSGKIGLNVDQESLKCSFNNVSTCLQVVLLCRWKVGYHVKRNP